MVHHRAHMAFVPIHEHKVFQTYKQELYTLNNLIRLVIVGSSISFFVIISMLEILQIIITFSYGQISKYIANRDKGKAEVRTLTQTQIIYNSQFIVSNVQMFIVLLAVCTFGVVFGVIQASMDPENHKCNYAIIFYLGREINKSKPIGCVLGLIFGILLEAVRQYEIINRPTGKNTLE